MTLTVPTAPVNAGARAPTLRVETPQTGGVIADFGAVVQQVGTAIETDRLDREAQQLQLDITRDLGAARLEFEQMTDPDQIDRLWPQRMAELQQSYLQGAREDGRPRVDPKLRGRIGMVFQELGDRHALALGANSVALRHSQRAATYIAYQAETGAQAAVVDLETTQSLIAGEIEMLNGMLAAGSMTPEQHAAGVAEANARLLGAYAIGLIDRDPAAFQEQAQAGLLNGLGERLSPLLVQSQNAMDRQAASAATEAERLAREAEVAEAANLRRITDVVGRGGRISVADRDLVAGSTHQLGNAARAALALADEIPDLARKSPADIQALIRAEETRTVAEGYQLERVEYLRQLQAQLQTGYNSDPVATDAATGGAVAALPQFDPGAPEAFTGGLAQRMAQGFDRAAAGKGVTPQFLTSAERETYRTQAAPEADPAGRARLIQSALTAAQSLPPAQRRQALTGFLTEVGASEVMRHAADLMAGGGRADLVPTMLRGEQKRQLGTVAVPSEAQQRMAFQAVTGGAMGDLPTQSGRIIKAAEAIYADMAGAIDPESMKAGTWAQGEAQQLYTRAVQMALGAQPDRNGDLTVGGVQTIRGAATLLPVGVARDEVERTMEDVDALLRGGRWRAQGDLSGWDFSQATGPNLGALQRASQDRQRIPQLTWGHWQDTAIEPVPGTSYYRLRYRADGGPGVIVPDDRGEEFRFSLPILMMEARQ